VLRWVDSNLALGRLVPVVRSTEVSVIEPQPNPETVEALLDTTWRLADAEAARTDALDRKAATVATFASVLGTLTATLGIRFVERLESWWALTFFVLGLALFVASVGLAIRALLPREYVTLGMEYIRKLPTWSRILQEPSQVRGEAMRGLVEAIAIERRLNEKKVRSIRWSLFLLFAGLVLVSAEAATLGASEVTS
jgi:hypothetical protein